MDIHFVREPADDTLYEKFLARREDDCPHDPKCERAVGGYEYYDEMLKPVTVTSMPLNNEEAFSYFKEINSRGRTWRTAYVGRRPCKEHAFKILPVRFDPDTGELTRKEG